LEKSMYSGIKKGVIKKSLSKVHKKIIN